ncbi:DUF2844 domain-containing protein [Candidatus Magnetominusculus dajiuhuensis]|uniref:DUF2844 domain-containing protein n=1 Tax=Candidatus Magnetominusculus dajiuhuensis TaxID=3137712 RepID=UPI003B436816
MSADGISGSLAMRRFALFIVFAILAAVLLPSRRVNAAIGGSIDSVESDRKALSATNPSVPQMVFDGYTVAEINSGASAIREYISPDGVVFGVAWNGPVHPDVTPLLGSYDDEYVNALRQTPRVHGKRHSRVKTASGLIVERWGHMRSVKGRAYVPELIPSGASVDNIK